MRGAPDRLRLTLEVEERRIALRRPWRSASGVVRARSLLEIRAHAADGMVGCGEALAPLQADDAALRELRAALERYRALLHAGSPGRSSAELIVSARRADPLPHALAGLEMALLDLEAKRAGLPLWRHLLGGGGERTPPTIAVNATIGAIDAEQAAAQAQAAAAEGFSAIKVKVGDGSDGERVAAVRAGAGAQVALRLDANGAWDVERAIARISALEGCGLELVEEPVHGRGALTSVRAAVAAEIAADESAGEEGLLGSGAVDAVCLKVARFGISGLLACARAARAVGVAPYLASLLDGPLGIAAAVHLATVLALEGPLPPCGLATLAELDCDPGPLLPQRGLLRAPAAPGLGVEPAW